MMMWVGRVMEACDHQAEELRLCPEALQRVLRVVSG